MAEENNLNNNLLLKIKSNFLERSIFVDTLLIFFGIGSWLGINSTFLQIPLLIDTAPEGWRLPSFIIVTIQIGNVGPLIYTIINRYTNLRIPDAHFIYGVKLIGAISTILMAFLYEKTIKINDTEYSLALLVLIFFLAIVACTSSVLFMPYMGRFKEIYLVTYLIGEGVSGLIPSIIALVQGIGGPVECILVDNTTTPPTFEPTKPNPRFSIRVFYLFVFAIMTCSLIAFLLLEKLPKCRKEYASVKINTGNTYEYIDEKCTRNCLTSKQIKVILILLAIISIIGNGILPSIQSYSCLPYGNEIYHLCVTLTLIANPISCLLATVLPHSSLKLIFMLVTGFSMTSIYILVIALLSPSPILVASNIGGILIVLVWTIHTSIFSYLKLCITTKMRENGGNSLVLTGTVAQFSTAVGSIFIFLLVNFTKIFTSKSPC